MAMGLMNNMSVTALLLLGVGADVTVELQLRALVAELGLKSFSGNFPPNLGHIHPTFIQMFH